MTIEVNIARFGEGLINWVGAMTHSILISPSSLMSLWALAFAFALSAFWLTVQGHSLSTRFLKRVYLPKRLITGQSEQADWGMTLAAFFVFPSFFAITTLSAMVISSWISASLTTLHGGATLLDLAPFQARLWTTVLGFLAFEFAYFLNHLLSHKIPFLWEFHKVHHTAEKLSPLTVFRVHPIDSLVYSNMSALCVGSVTGLCIWLFGVEASPWRIDGMNAILLVFAYLLVNLQHTQIWMPFNGWLGRTLLSPAHHQLHHSSDPSHFNSNYGNVLACWDLLFRTLRMPPARNPNLKYGAEGLSHNPHSPTGMLLVPFLDALSKNTSQATIGTTNSKHAPASPQRAAPYPPIS